MTCIVHSSSTNVPTVNMPRHNHNIVRNFSADVVDDSVARYDIRVGHGTQCQIYVYALA